MPEFPVFKGNCPANVAKDAKYTVRSGKTGPVVALSYNTRDDERWYMATENHPELVAMVNAVKGSQGAAPNGSFYINEYSQVIVPVVGSAAYYFAGIYKKRLRFEFEGKTLSGEPRDWDGNPIMPGDDWMGPHPGIPYVLAAGGSDVYYESTPRPNVRKKLKLSKTLDRPTAAEVAGMICKYKGQAGGRFYVNEFRSIFAPVQEGYDWRYIYIGELDLSNWFPEHAYEINNPVVAAEQNALPNPNFRRAVDQPRTESGAIDDPLLDILLEDEEDDEQ